MKKEYEQFCENLLSQLKLALGEEYTLYRDCALGYNSTYKDVLLVRKQEETSSPRFCLMEYYEAYQRGESLEDLIQRIQNVVLGNYGPSKEQINTLLTKENAKEHLIVRLINRKKNEELLKETPYLPFLDLAITFHLLLSGGEEGVKSIRLTKKLWDEVIDAPLMEMYEIALQNTEKMFPPRLEALEALFGWSEKECTSSLFVLTNQYGVHGASAFLYEGIAQKIEQTLGGDYYVIPSSVHELLFIAKEKIKEVDFLKDTILEVNHTQVGKEEVLSDLLYQYQNHQLDFA